MDIPLKTSPAASPAQSPDAGRVATLLLDGRGVVSAWSRAAEDLFGYSAAEVVGRPADELWPKAFPDLLRQPLATADTAGGPARTVALTDRQGRRLEVGLLVSSLASGEPGGEGTAVLVFPARLPEREEDRAILDGLFTQSPIGLAVYDTDLRLVRMNAALESIQGVPPEKVLGHRVSEFLPEIDAEAIERRLRTVLSTGLPVVDSVHRGRTPADPDRDHVWNVSSFALTAPDGRVLGVTDAVIDITDRYRARDRLAFLDWAAAHIGTALDVTRTAEEVAQVVVPRFADYVAIDLLEGVVVGDEPELPETGTVPLRRAAHKASRPEYLKELVTPGNPVNLPAQSPYTRCLSGGRPMLLPFLDPQADWIRNAVDPRIPRIVEGGARSVMLLPLRVGETTLGLVHMYRTVPAVPFEQDDLVLAQELAARVAVSMDNARRYTREHRAAVTLHESMLPRSVPEQSAVGVAHCFIPARAHAGVSGDWFDVIPLSGARVALVIGDVPGTGVQAAACMGQICSAVRTLSQMDLCPEELLARLDDMVPRLLEREHVAGSPPIVEALVGATCLYAVYDPVTRRCVMAGAGHPPPFLCDPQGRTCFADLPANSPLGLGDAVFEPLDLQLAEGSTLAFYTASLARASAADPAVSARLRTALRRRDRPLSETCRAMADALVGHLASEDDLALLVARTRSLPADHVATWELPQDPAVVADVRARVGRQLDRWSLGDLAFTTELIVSELVTNAIRYGAEPLRLRLIHDRTLVCEVSDSSSTSPHIRRATGTDEGGRGLFLVAQCSHRWGRRYTPNGKIIWSEQLIDGSQDLSAGGAAATAVHHPDFTAA